MSEGYLYFINYQYNKKLLKIYKVCPKKIQMI